MGVVGDRGWDGGGEGFVSGEMVVVVLKKSIAFNITTYGISAA